MRNQCPDDTAMGVLRKVKGWDVVAVTLACGHLVNRDSTREMFEPARITEEKRNEQDRCTRLVGTYKDGSSLVFTWNPQRGHRYEHRAAMAKAA